MAHLGKTALQKKLSQKLNIPAKESEVFLNAFVEVVTEELKSGNNVVIPNFISLSMKNGRMLSCRNPRTGARMFVHTLPSVKSVISKAVRKQLAGEQVKHILAYLPGIDDIDQLQELNTDETNVRFHLAGSLDEAKLLLLDLPVSLLLIHDGVSFEEYAALTIGQKIQEDVVNPQIAGIAMEGEFGYDFPEAQTIPDFVMPIQALLADIEAFTLAISQMIGESTAVKLVFRTRIMPEMQFIQEYKTLLIPLFHQSHLNPEKCEQLMASIEEILDWAVAAGTEIKSNTIDITFMEASEGITLRIEARDPLFQRNSVKPAEKRIADFRTSIVEHGADQVVFAEDGTSVTLTKQG